MKNLKYLVLLVVILFGFVLRVYNVTSIPPSLSWDEVSIGYNAYSILRTGHDEHGRYFPLDAFAAYGDYKPTLPIYLTVPFVAIFGLNEFAVRLPSVLAGALTIIALYFFTKELLGSDKLSIIAALLLAISPWHIQLSRVGFEANIALLFVVLGAYLLIKRIFIIAWLPFVAAIYTFNSARYVVVLLGIICIVFLKKAIIENRRSFIIGLFLALIALLPVFPHLLSKEARLRFAEVNIFTDPGIVTTSNERMSVDGGWWGNLFHNRRVGYARSYLLHFFDNLEPSFLFIRGDGNPKFSLQDVGQLYIVEFPFLILGFIWLFRDRRSVAGILLAWLVAAIAPAAIARETPHALRIENALPVFLIAISYGISKIATRKLLVVVIAVLYAFSFFYFWHNYINHYPEEFSGEWQYGYKQAIARVAPIKNNYKKIVLSENIGRAYMYVLFYEGIDPRDVKANIKGSFDGAGFYNVSSLGGYQFSKNITSYEKNTLYILSPKDVPQGANVIDEVRLLNGTTVLTIFTI